MNGSESFFYFFPSSNVAQIMSWDCISKKFFLFLIRIFGTVERSLNMIICIWKVAQILSWDFDFWNTKAEYLINQIINTELYTVDYIHTEHTENFQKLPFSACKALNSMKRSNWGLTRSLAWLSLRNRFVNVDAKSGKLLM